MPEPIDLAAFDVGLDKTLGIVWDEISPTRAVNHVDLDERHHQPMGIAHGGLYCAMIEGAASVGAMANVYDQGKAAVGVNNNTDFLRPAGRGRVTATATPIHRGRLTHLWRVEITSQNGKTVAIGKVRLQIIDANHRLPDGATTSGAVSLSAGSATSEPTPAGE